MVKNNDALAGYLNEEVLSEVERLMLAMERERAEAEIRSVTNILLEKVPALLELRVFGSYLREKWDPERSDIDLFVLTADERYSYRDWEELPDQDEESIYIRMRESLVRRNLRRKIASAMDKAGYTNRFGMHIVSKEDLFTLIGPETGYAFGPRDFAEKMLEGRLLYKYQKPSMLSMLFENVPLL